MVIYYGTVESVRHHQLNEHSCHVECIIWQNVDMFRFTKSIKGIPTRHLKKKTSENRIDYWWIQVWSSTDYAIPMFCHLSAPESVKISSDLFPLRIFFYVGVSKNRVIHKSSILIWVFHYKLYYKPSILGYPCFRKHPYCVLLYVVKSSRKLA